jgi:hypothetical protein
VFRGSEDKNGRTDLLYLGRTEQEAEMGFMHDNDPPLREERKHREAEEHRQSGRAVRRRDSRDDEVEVAEERPIVRCKRRDTPVPAYRRRDEAPDDENERDELGEPRRRGRNDFGRVYEDDDEVDVHDGNKGELIEALKRIERCRENLMDAGARFNQLTRKYPLLDGLWEEFVEMGGTGSHDLERHLAGKIIRARLTRRKGHLRIVASRDSRIAHRYRGDDDDAA